MNLSKLLVLSSFSEQDDEICNHRTVIKSWSYSNFVKFGYYTILSPVFFFKELTIIHTIKITKSVGKEYLNIHMSPLCIYSGPYDFQGARPTASSSLELAPVPTCPVLQLLCLFCIHYGQSSTWSVSLTGLENEAWEKEWSMCRDTWTHNVTQLLQITQKTSPDHMSKSGLVLWCIFGVLTLLTNRPQSRPRHRVREQSLLSMMEWFL